MVCGCNAASRRSPTIRHRCQCFRSARLAQEAEGGRLNKQIKGTAKVKGFLCFTAALTLLVLVGTGSSVKASSITETVDFTASNFSTAVGSTPAPEDPVKGSFTITFDPTMSVSGGTTISFNSINIALSAQPVFFNYAAGGELDVCSSSSASPICGITEAENSFELQINDFATSPTFTGFSYTQSGVDALWDTNDGSATVVPIPGALPLFATGLGAMGLLGWRRKRKNAAALAA